MIRTLSPSGRLICGLLVAALCVSSRATLLEQKPGGAVNDFAGVLSDDTKSSCEQLSRALLQKTGVSLVVVTAPSLDGGDIDDVANRLFKTWGIGRKGTDEGVLVLVALAERSIRIETGYGAEGYITDAQSKRIIRDIATPYLSKGQWDPGIFNTLLALGELAARAHNTSLNDLIGYEPPSSGPAGGQNVKLNPVVVVCGVLLLLFLVGTRVGRSILFMLILSSVFSGSRSGYGSSGFGGGFGRSGGFGGFGGGMSGGGGASGRF
ncbi:MAG: TPM domain-containing protein [Chitinivibrionales bacterium]